MEFRVWVLGFRALRNGNRSGSYDFGFRIRGLAFQISGSVVVHRRRLAQCVGNRLNKQLENDMEIGAV